MPNSYLTLEVLNFNLDIYLRFHHQTSINSLKIVLKKCSISQPFNNDYAKFIAVYLNYHLNDELLNNQPSVFELKGSTREFDEFLQDFYENNMNVPLESRIQRFRCEFVNLVHEVSEVLIQAENSLSPAEHYSVNIHTNLILETVD